MLNIYVIRHGQTVWNKERRFQGWLDSPLTEEGEARALHLRDQLSTISFDAVCVSTSPRAVKTAELIIGKTYEHFLLDARLMEMRLGAWQGMTHDTVEKEYPDALRAFYETPHLFAMEDSETYQDIYNRTALFVQDLVSNYNQQNAVSNILIVTHGLTLMMLKLYFEGKTIDAIVDERVSPNGVIHHFYYDDQSFALLSRETV